jgi:hypothetical protein
MRHPLFVLLTVLFSVSLFSLGSELKAQDLGSLVSGARRAVGAGGSLRGEGEADSLIAVALDLLGKGRAHEGLDLLKPYFPPADRSELEASESHLVDLYSRTGSRWGRATGVEKLKSCRVGSFLYKVQYAVKFDRDFLGYTFVFYNSGSGWTVQSMKSETRNFSPLSETCN